MNHSASVQQTTEFRLDGFGSFGDNLHRPECVLATDHDIVYCSDSRGGVMKILPDGSQRLLGSAGSQFTPNGIAYSKDEQLIFANMGPDGGIWAIDPNNESDSTTINPYLLEIDGAPIGPVNFVLFASDDSLWFSVLSTGHHLPLSASRADGYVGRIKEGRVEVMADGLVSANEFRFDDARGAFYINETFARRTTKFDLTNDGKLCNRRVFASHDKGSFPDGMAIDVEGNLWVTCIVANKLLLITPCGDIHTVFEDGNQHRVDAVEQALQQENLTRHLIYSDDGTSLQNPTSIAFGGLELTKCYIGSLTGDSVRTFFSPVAGMPLQHWKV